MEHDFSLLLENMAYLRKKNKRTQEQTANLLNISRHTYINYEIGYRVPTLETFVKIADLYETKLDDLIHKDLKKAAEVK